MYGDVESHLKHTLDEIRDAGLWKPERVIATPQDAHIRVASGSQVLNLCANNYLGLADHPQVIGAAKLALDQWGFGMASVRFICGTQQIHKELERRISEFLGTEDTILYSSCFDANGGLFETILGEEDAVIFSRKKWALPRTFSCSSLDRVSRLSTSSEAAQITGAREFENR